MVAMTRAEWVAHAHGRTPPNLPWKEAKRLPVRHFAGFAFGAVRLPPIDASRMADTDVGPVVDQLVQYASSAASQVDAILAANPKFPGAADWRNKIASHLSAAQQHGQMAKLHATHHAAAPRQTTPAPLTKEQRRALLF